MKVMFLKYDPMRDISDRRSAYTLIYFIIIIIKY